MEKKLTGKEMAEMLTYKKKNVFVIGCGRWGSCIAWYLDSIGHEVTLYGREGSANMRRFLDKYGKYMEFCQIQLNWLDWSFQDAKTMVTMLKERNIPVWVMEPVRGGKLAALECGKIILTDLLERDLFLCIAQVDVFAVCLHQRKGGKQDAQRKGDYHNEHRKLHRHSAPSVAFFIH